MAKSCDFCHDPAVQARAIVRRELVWAFPGYMPIVPGHVLMCPVRHVGTLSELTGDELKAIFSLLTDLKPALKKAFGAQGFNYAVNEGEIAGQFIPHLHIHMLPRKPGDAGVTKYEPRDFLYRPRSRAQTPQAELEEVARLIKENL